MTTMLTRTKMPTMTLERFLRDTAHVLTGEVMTIEGNEVRRNDGIRTGEYAEYVTIALNDVWSARGKDDSQTSSYEKIGYHTGSVDFIAGVLSTGCPVVLYRLVQGVVTELRLVA